MFIQDQLYSKNSATLVEMTKKYGSGLGMTSRLILFHFSGFYVYAVEVP